MVAEEITHPHLSIQLGSWVKWPENQSLKGTGPREPGGREAGGPGGWGAGGHVLGVQGLRARRTKSA